MSQNRRTAVPGSFLEEYDDFNVESAFCHAASASMAYALLSRCGLEPDLYPYPLPLSVR